MNFKRVVLLCALVMAISLPTFLVAQTAAEAAAAQQSTPQIQPGAAAAKAMQSAAGVQQQSQVPQQQPQMPAQVSEPGPNMPETQASAPLRVMVGKSLLITTTDKLRRVSVTDPTIADALVVTPTQVLVHGRAPGEVSLILWDEQERSRSFDLRVDADVTAAAQEIHRIFPDEKISVEASRNAIVLSGHVATKEDAERAGQIAGAYSKNVVNVLTYGPVGAQEVLLEVRFAEVNRTELMQLGANFFSTGLGNTFGQISTQQFGPLAGARVGSIPAGVQGGGQAAGSSIASGAVGNPQGLTGQPASFGFNDLLNIFLFRSDANIGALIRALQQKNVLQILAEPNLIAVNGKEASFLAGGEFPFPVVQSGGGLNSVTIQFKEFGVRLSFTPLIKPNGNINLQVKPEVSALDFTNAVTLSGFLVPALSTRRASTEFEIQDGQSFVIAGLMDNRLTNISSKVPGLGDIPILGTLFKSKSLQKSKTELMVLVTAHKISPSMQPPAGPKFPQKFMDEKQDQKPADGK
ncbi:MAG TPA: type II and III secretion system protein family protein [Terriglobales bacterium]|nr:type II and III secretion system protein family protein [Terriglobales bacterium]